MEFVEALGTFVLMAVILFLFAYGLRHRGAVKKWLENTGHKDNAEEKDDEIVRLRREREDIDRDLERLERKD